MGAGEFDYLHWLSTRIPQHSRVLLGPGDDCAVLAPAKSSQLVTTDVLTEGIDFLLAEVGGRAVGRKAMAVNLSDIAAMAGRPTAAVVGLVLPQGPGSRVIAQEIFEGLKEVADRFDIAIIGGDTNTWAGGLVVSVTMLGEVTERGPVLRSGAKPGDWLFVTGPCGGSILGRHLAPNPRIAEAIALHKRVDLHAMIDISDGLTADLHHILTASGCGAVLDAATIPIHPDAVTLALRTGTSALEHALGDGEDFELVFAVAPTEGARLVGEGFIKIGECVDDGLWLTQEGRRLPLAPTGWVHPVG